MKKKILSVILVLCLLLPLVPSAFAHTGTSAETISAPAISGEKTPSNPLPTQESPIDNLPACEAADTKSATRYSDTDTYPVEGGNLYFDPETGTITVADDSVTAAVIPSEINGVAVTAIGEYAFAFYCTSLTSVTIPNSVTSIGSSAFAYCESLTSVAIPDSVTTIGSGAFSGCTSLTSVTIPDGVTYIGYRAFSECTSLTGIWVDENNESYSSDEYGVLFDKDKTTLIQAPGAIVAYTIPDSVASIGDDAFYKCTS